MSIQITAADSDALAAHRQGRQNALDYFRERLNHLKISLVWGKV
ncbi:hypothetical protein [Escherichia sp. ESNIH1]|nr:hypothetical protein [Escherichia sp. ESNIH1]